MSPLTSTSAVLPPSWEQVLDNVQQARARTAAETAERERVFPSEVNTARTEDERENAWRQHWEQLDARLRERQQVLHRAEAAALAAAAALQAGEEELRRWRDHAAAIRQRLADGAGRAV
jgi:hypothetical protein